MCLKNARVVSLEQSWINRPHGSERRPRRPKNKRPPGYYLNLIERHHATINNSYAEVTKDNLSGTKSKFIG
jgi:hypothetical protein